MRLYPLKTSLLLSVLISFLKISAQDQTLRTKENINTGWYYTENPANNLETVRREKNWTKINLPHSWNNEDTMDNIPGYRRNTSWYRKNIEIPFHTQDKKYSLFFEGANITTKVFVNGSEAGNHVGGYLGFEIDITPYIKNGANEIHVRVDNKYNRDIIPSQKSDFFIYGGITRDVWLLSKPILSIKKVHLTSPKVSHELANLKIQMQLIDINNSTKLNIRAVLKDPYGVKVAEKTIGIKMAETTLEIDNISHPHLWDVEDPNLYKVEIELLKNGEVLDKVTETFGFRWFEFKKNGPFYLNGRRLLLRGTHRHEEHAGYGAAMPNQLHRRDMEQIKEMGANFVRLAHYPQDPEIYKACDELGILVWDELPWCRGGIGEKVWQGNTKRMLREMIHQNYNHPSIILWSLGNEIYWLPDFENGDDTIRINAFLDELNTMVHEIDPSRKTALRKYYEGAEIVDVFSPSIWSGWYSGSYKNYKNAIATYKIKYPHFLHAEYGASSHLGRHTAHPITGEGIFMDKGWEEAIVQTGGQNIAKIGDWSENYAVDLFDWHLSISEQDSTFVGNVQWAFKDFGTPLRPENDIPYVNQKGIMDRDGNPKDAYFVFKSYWAEKPFVYIESKTWKERQRTKNPTSRIKIYSNCEKVRLLHNGNDLGERTKDIKLFPASGLVWDVSLSEGSNQLIALATIDEMVVTDTLDVQYRHTKNGPAKKLQLSYETTNNDKFLVKVTAVDANGLRCLDYEHKVYFQCLQGGKTLKNQGTPMGSEVIAMANGFAQIQVIPDGKGPILLMAQNQDFKGTYLEIK